MKLAPLFCCACSLVSFSLCSAVETPAAPFLMLDFGTKNSPVQSGFTPATASAAQIKGPLVYEFEGYDKKSTAHGVIAVTIAAGDALDSGGALCARDRGDAPFATRSGQDDLYRDFIAGPSIMTVGIAGLKPGGLYEVTFYAFDKIRAQTLKIEDFTGGIRNHADAILSYDAKTSAADADAGALRATLPVKAPASGTITFRMTSVGGGSAILNALVLTSLKTSAP